MVGGSASNRRGRVILFLSNTISSFPIASNYNNKSMCCSNILHKQTTLPCFESHAFLPLLCNCQRVLFRIILFCGEPGMKGEKIITRPTILTTGIVSKTIQLLHSNAPISYRRAMKQLEHGNRVCSILLVRRSLEVVAVP